jgi:transposase
MLMLPAGIKIWVATNPTDMRRSFFGLAAMVKEVLEQDPAQGHLFVFSNKQHDKIKILYWDRTGFAIWYKQLAEGIFRLPRAQGCQCYSISSSDLSLLLEGIALTHKQRIETVLQTDIN